MSPIPYPISPPQSEIKPFKITNDFETTGIKEAIN